jgi:hypothetical protein
MSEQHQDAGKLDEAKEIVDMKLPKDGPITIWRGI